MEYVDIYIWMKMLSHLLGRSLQELLHMLLHHSSCHSLVLLLPVITVISLK